MQLPNRIITTWRSISLDMRRRITMLFSALILANIFVWIGGIFFAFKNPFFLGLLTLAYGLGLRHAVDADHIAAIDNTTRKLMLDGKKPLGVGLYFSLGHSTIVIVLSLLVALSASFVKSNLPSFQTIGTLIGTSVSSFFLLLIGLINLISFINLLRIFLQTTKGNKVKELTHNQLQVSGFLAKFLKPVFNSIHSSSQMYFVGLLFGLGFDTASEVGLLSISAASSASGISTWGILLLPLAFTAGMALIDTLDGILMLGAYGWANIRPVRKLYYNLNITFISVIIAFFIGGIEAIQLFSEKFSLHGFLIDFINTISLANVGYLTILAFILSWVVSLFVYRVKGYDHLSV